MYQSLACILIALGIALGAFGAHGLRGRVPEADLGIWNTAVFYHLFHALALLVLSQMQITKIFPLHLMLAGVIIFSGSLYALVLSNIRVLGAITPLGGTALIIAWILIGVMLFRK